MNIKKLFAISLILTSCAQVKVSDSEWCGDMGPEGAYCFKTFSDSERELTQAEWDEERFGMICTSSESFRNFKAVIQKLCYSTKRCTYDTQKKIDIFFSKTDSYDTKRKNRFND